MTLFFLNASVVPSASSVRCVRMQRLRSWARLHVRLSRFACMLRLLSPAIVRKTRGRDCGQRLSRKGARPLLSALPHGSPESRSDDPRRTTDAQRENIDMHGRLHGVRLSSTYLCTGGRSLALSSTYVCRASLAPRLHDTTTIPSDCSEN